MCAIRFLCHPRTPSRGQLPRAFLPTSKIPKGRYDQPAQTHPFAKHPLCPTRNCNGIAFGPRFAYGGAAFLGRLTAPVPCAGREGIPQGTLANAKGSGALLTIPLLNLVARSLAALRR